MTETDYENWVPDPQIVAVVDKRMSEVRDTMIKRMHNPDHSDDPKRVYVGVSHEKARNMLRLDWELILDNFDTVPSNETILDMIITQMSVDFYDMLENGDSNENHPILSLFDGKKKTGKDLVDIHLGDIAIYVESKPRKNSIEYTIYTRLSPVWS